MGIASKFLSETFIYGKCSKKKMMMMREREREREREMEREAVPVAVLVVHVDLLASSTRSY